MYLFMNERKRKSEKRVEERDPEPPHTGSLPQCIPWLWLHQTEICSQEFNPGLPHE